MNPKASLERANATIAQLKTENAHLRQVIAEALILLDGPGETFNLTIALQTLRKALKPK